MEKENKKVNNAENTKPVSSSAHDDVTDGFFDLSKVYAKKETRDRARELKKKDEARRALEMQAIKEDIERRYSLQLETAKSNTAPEEKPSSNLMPEIDEREAVKEELERIDKIIDSDVISGKKEKNELASIKKKKRKSKKKPAKEEPEFDIDEANSVYAAIYGFGDIICKILVAVFSFVFDIIKKPAVYIAKSVSKAGIKTKQKAVKSIRATLREAVTFRQEIKHALKTIKRSLKSPLSLVSVLIHYIRKAIHRHKALLKTAANILMPLGALAIFVITFNYWNNATFALEVIYNDQSIGYISDESIFIEAKKMVQDRLSSSAYADKSTIEAPVAAASSNLRADYNLSVVSIDKLNDAQAISDRMIENSVDNLTHACGIYIDGEFICAVKNESDAKTVFYDILEPYEADAELNGYVVGFAETIDYVQGLYRDDEDAMWDASELMQILTGENKLVSIRKIVTSTSIRDIEYDTVKKRDATKYSGYRQVLQKGVNGSERVTKTQIYIDGELQDTEYSYETITEPIDEIVTVGTRTSYGGVYIGEASDKGFLWPAPSCHSVSSPYGWRSSGWHNGIDLIRGGGGALGTPVIASQSGRVEVVQRSSSGYGNMVLINHGNGYKTRYAHMVKGSITVSVGDYVEAGQTIGKVGSTGNSTGPHLHFEVIYRGETQNPKYYIY